MLTLQNVKFYTKGLHSKYSIYLLPLTQCISIYDEAVFNLPFEMKHEFLRSTCYKNNNKIVIEFQILFYLFFVILLNNYDLIHDIFYAFRISMFNFAHINFLLYHYRRFCSE